MKFKPYKDNEYLENSYYKIPQELFVSSLYKDKLNSDSKILYAFLLDRLSLLQKNHWFDEYGRVITNSKILSKISLINKDNLIQLLDIAKNSSNIKNITNYLMICLYNNLGHSNMRNNNKTAISTREYERKYPDGFFDCLYANFPCENTVASS